MRTLKSYLSMLFLGALALTGCQDDFDDPKLQEPVSTWLEDTASYETWSIAQLKETYWQDADNYYTTVGEAESGKHILVRGRVISSDAAGNIYKSLVIQDETAALAMSINQNSMNVKYRPGQELVIDVTGMTIGKYASLQQLGAPEDSEQYGKQTTFMPYEVFEAHSQMNGLPDPSAIRTITVNSMSELTGGPETLRKWQSQKVRFNNVEFQNGGVATFAENKVTVNQTLLVDNGNNSIIVRTSGYANFYADVLPAGRGDVEGILSYHTSGGWQLLLINREGCMNFGNPTIGPGGEDNPYTVDDAIALESQGGQATGVWTQGYIVGAVAPGVNEVSKNEDIQFASDPELDNTLVIAGSADCRDYTKCMVIQLPQGSKLRQYGNLVTNPANFGKKISLKGNLAKVLGTYGITGNQGTTAEFKIEGVDVPADPGTEQGDGSAEKPYTVSQVIAMGNPGTQAWVQGYIVGSAPGKSADTFTTATGAEASNTNVFIAATAGETDYTKCVAVQLPANMRDAVSLQKNPGNLGKVLSINGTLEKYFGMAGVKTLTDYKLDGQGGGGDTPVTPPAGDGDGSKEKPYTVGQTIALGNPGTQAWVEGYIVGSAADKTADSFTTATGAAASNTNLFIAASASETDYTKCVAVQLPANMRDALSLQKNPGNLGKKLKIYGSLERYFGMTGVKSATDYELDGQSGGGDTPVTPPAGDGGTKTNPYTVAQVIVLNNPGTTAWVEGYIVGLVDGPSIDGAKFENLPAIYSNLLIADAPDCKDAAKCVPVQLPANSEIRRALNLGDNPGNLGKKVNIQGTLTKYFGVPGLKTPTDFEMK